MHYAKRIARAHRTLRNRLRVLRSLVDDWPLGAPQEEGVTDLTREDLKSEVKGWSDRMGSLKHTATFAGSDRAQENAAAEAEVLRERIDRVERSIEALDESGKRSIRAAILKMFREKFRIERYCQWHARTKGMNPISRHPQFYQPRDHV